MNVRIVKFAVSLVLLSLAIGFTNALLVDLFHFSLYPFVAGGAIYLLLWDKIMEENA